MRCFYHANRDASGICPQCGRAACRACLRDAGSIVICPNCADLRIKATEAASRQHLNDRQAIINRAKRQISVSHVVFIAAFALSASGIAGIFLRGTPVHAPLSAHISGIAFNGLTGSLSVAYSVWSMYWGIPPFWRFLMRARARMGIMLVNPFMWIGFFFLVMVSMIAGVYASLFGSGIFQYIKRWKLAVGRF